MFKEKCICFIISVLLYQLCVPCGTGALWEWEGTSVGCGVFAEALAVGVMFPVVAEDLLLPLSEGYTATETPAGVVRGGCVGADRGDWEPSALYFIPPRRQVGERGYGRVKPIQLNIGVFIMRGCSTNDVKKGENGKNVFERRLDVCALSETKFKRKGEVLVGEVVGRVYGVKEGRRYGPIKNLRRVSSKSWQINVGISEACVALRP